MTQSRDTEDDLSHVWHPFTQMQGWTADHALMIEQAEGCYLIDNEGRRYFDGVSSLWVNVHGHQRPELDAAITQQLGKVAHTTLLGLANQPAAELAGRLAALCPGDLNRVFYSDSGSTAVEIALKQAYQYWCHCGRPKKHRFVHLAEGYHGDTLGAVAVGGIGLFHEVFGPLIVPQIEVLSPAPRLHPGLSHDAVLNRCLEHLRSTLTQHADQIAALIVEPLVQGAGGMLTHVPGYLAQASQLCREHEVLLIVDEVATGFGRTGRMFACEHEDVVPDLLCLAKGITGGYLPLAATVAREEIYSAFLGAQDERKTFFHGHTYTGNPLACAVANASLDVFAADQTVAGVEDKALHLRTQLAPLEDHPNVLEIRNRGLMFGVELVRSKIGTPTPFEYSDSTGAKVCQAARKHGAIIRPLGDVIVLMPPLAADADDLSLLADALVAAVAEVLPVP